MIPSPRSVDHSSGSPAHPSIFPEPRVLSYPATTGIRYIIRAPSLASSSPRPFFRNSLRSNIDPDPSPLPTLRSAPHRHPEREEFHPQDSSRAPQEARTCAVAIETLRCNPRIIYLNPNDTCLACLINSSNFGHMWGGKVFSPDRNFDSRPPRILTLSIIRWLMPYFHELRECTRQNRKREREMKYGLILIIHVSYTRRTTRRIKRLHQFCECAGMCFIALSHP